jgi:polyhydroxybutyrate depolymerase
VDEFPGRRIGSVTRPWRRVRWRALVGLAVIAGGILGLGVGGSPGQVPAASTRVADRAVPAASTTVASPAVPAASTTVASPAVPAPAAVDPCTTAVSGTGGDRDVEVRVDGYERTVRIYAPGRQPAGRRLPVIVGLHGFRDTGKGMERYSGLSALGARDGFIVAYPDALGGNWAIYSSGARGDADLDLVRATLDWAETHYCVDRSRVFAVGVSNGGGEASRVACALADRIAGVAIVAGDYRRMPLCAPARPVSIFDIHATSDPVVPYLGAPGTHDGSVPRFLAMWRSRDGCSVPGSHTRVDPGALRSRWTCTGGTTVAQLRLTHGGHFWPGGTRSASTLPAAGSAGAEIWDFFSGLPPRRA